MRNNRKVYVNHEEKDYLKKRGIKEGKLGWLKDKPVRYVAQIFEEHEDTNYVSFFGKRDYRDHYIVRIIWKEDGTDKRKY